MWGGAKLADVLELLGVPKLSTTTSRGGKHVEFVSVDRCKVILLCLLWSIYFLLCSLFYQLGEDVTVFFPFVFVAG